MIKKLLLFTVFLAFTGYSFCSPPDSLASRKQAIVIDRLTSAINFDGIPDEDAWKEMKPLKMTMHSPVFGKEPTEATDVRITYDDKNLYIGAWVYFRD